MFTDWEKVIQVEAVKKSLRARTLESAIFDSYIFQEPWENCLYVLRLSFPIRKIIVQLLSHIQLFSIPWAAAHQASLSFPLRRVCSNSHPLSQRCRPTILFSVIPFSSCPQSFPESGSFSMRHFFTLGDQIIGASTSASVLRMNIQG